MGLLLQYLGEDPRRQVQEEVLSDLYLLAGAETAHLWTRDNIENVIEYIHGLEKEQLQVDALNVLIKIVENGGVYELEVGAGSPIINLCQTLSCSPKLPVAAAATQLLTKLAVSCIREGVTCTDIDIISEAIQSIECLCLLASSGAGDAPFLGVQYLRRSFKCVILLCSTQPQSTGQFVDILGGMLLARYQDASSILPVCETLAALADMKQGVLSLLVPGLCNLIATIVTERELEYNVNSEESAVERNRGLVLLLTMLLQTFRGHIWSQDIEESFRSGVQIMDNWSRYRVARAASRYGEHRIGRELYTGLVGKVGKESQHYWLSSMQLFSLGEEILAKQDSKTLQEKLTSAGTVFQRGLTCLRAGSSAQQPLTFKIEFIKCRIQYLQVLTGLVSAATSLQTSPPPAIAAALAAQSRDDLQRCGRVTGQLRKVVKDLQSCAQQWGILAESSFDADAASLSEILVLQKAISALAVWIEIVCLKSSLQGRMYADTEIEFTPDMADDHSPSVELQSLINTFKKVASEFKGLSEKPDIRPISHHHTSCIFSCVRILNSSPLPYPRFFFQSLQETRLKLSVTPQPRTAGEPVSVTTAQFLAIKVEGVIERSCAESQQARKVSQVLVQLQSVLQSTKSERTPSHDKHQDPGTSLEQCADLQNDFFSVQFLAPFPLSGLYTLNLEAKFIDPEGHRSVRCFFFEIEKIYMYLTRQYLTIRSNR